MPGQCQDPEFRCSPVWSLQLDLPHFRSCPTDYFWCKSEKSSADRGGGNSEWFSRGEIHWCSLCSRYIVSSHPEIAKSVWSDGFSFYRLNTVKVNCHYFRLNPCDLVQETNHGVLQCYPCCALKWSGSEWVLLTEDQVNSSLLLFCCPFFFFSRRKNPTHWREYVSSFFCSDCFSSFYTVGCWLLQCAQYQDSSHLCPWWQFSLVSVEAVSIWDRRLGQVFESATCVDTALLAGGYSSSTVSLSIYFTSVLIVVQKKILHDSSYSLPQAQTMWAKCSRAPTAQLWLSVCKVSLTTVPQLPKLLLLQHSYKAQIFKVHTKSVKVIFWWWAYE